MFEWGDTQVLKLFAADRDAAAIVAEAQVSQLVHEAGLPTHGTGGVIEIVPSSACASSPRDGALPWRLPSRQCAG